MKLSTVKNNANDENMQDIIDIDDWSDHHFLPYERANQTQPTSTLTLS